MIPLHAPVSYKRLPLNRLIVGDNEPPKHLPAIEHYTGLLLSKPDQDTDPVVVEALGDGYYRIHNGHHRYIAHIVAGRSDIGAVVIGEPHGG